MYEVRIPKQTSYFCEAYLSRYRRASEIRYRPAELKIHVKPSSRNAFVLTTLSLSPTHNRFCCTFSFQNLQVLLFVHYCASTVLFIQSIRTNSVQHCTHSSIHFIPPPRYHQACQRTKMCIQIYLCVYNISYR